MILNHRRASLARVLATGFLMLLGGCGGSGEGALALHPAVGQVLFQGKPLANIQVTFRPANLDPNAPATVPMGRTDDQGKFRLSTFPPGESRPSEGAPVGDYLVALSTPGRSDSIGFTRQDAPKATPNLLGPRFADPRTSGLKATIKPGPNTLEPFDLK